MAEQAKNAPLDGEVVKAGFIAEIQLRHPIQDQEGNNITVLQIREPTTADYVAHGDPYHIRQGENGALIESNVKAGMGYLEACTGIHAALLKKLHVLDSMKAVGAISNFFAQA